MDGKHIALASAGVFAAVLLMPFPRPIASNSAAFAPSSSPTPERPAKPAQERQAPQRRSR